MSPDERVDARDALRILEGSGLSLTEAARRSVQAVGVSQATFLEDAIDSYVRRLLRMNRRKATVNYYDDVLRIFSRAFPGRTLDDFERVKLKAWFEGQPLAPATVRSYYRAVRVLFRWAVRQDPPLVALDPTEGLVLELDEPDRAVGFLSVEDCRSIMDGAGRYRSALALMLFAGVRPEEVAGRGKSFLDWSHVDCVGRVVRVPSEIAKTRRPRVLEGLPDALWAWLQPKDKGPVCPGHSRQAIRVAKIAANFGTERPWPKDGLRHTFATYHVAAFSDVGKTILLLGHEGAPAMFWNHYRGLATAGAAAEFWALRPQS